MSATNEQPRMALDSITFTMGMWTDLESAITQAIRPARDATIEQKVNTVST